MVDLPPRPLCTDCPLSAAAESPGLPTRPWDGGVRGKNTAVLVVGKAPALDEDAEGKCFVGPTGILTNKLYIESLSLHDHADFFLTNIVRCRLPNAKMAVPSPSATACRKHLEADLEVLSKAYPRVVLLATGAEATAALLGKSTSFSKFHQGCPVEVGGRMYPLFATYLATYLLPSGDPSKSVAVEAHLRLLEEYLCTGKLTQEVHVDLSGVDRTSRIPHDATLVSLDIETYGACHGYPKQRFFHPRKSLHWDKVDRRDLVLCCACAWRDPQTNNLRHRLYDCTSPQEEYELASDLSMLDHPVILGQNIGFDVMYLRAWGNGNPSRPDFTSLLEPFGPVRLIDLAVINFLECDARPERSLKALSPLLSIASYADEPVDLRKGERYVFPQDPRLWAYNVKDAIVTLRDYEVLTNHIRQKYGPSTPKCSEECLQWYSDELWLAISMGEEGIHHEVPRLEAAHNQLVHRVGVLREGAKQRHGAILGKLPWEPPKLSKGSGKYADALAERAAEELHLGSDPRLNLTAVKRKIACDSNNLNLFLGEAPRGSPLHRELRLLQRFRTLRDVISRYTAPMLALTQKDDKLPSALIEGVAYPQWYVVPTYGTSSGSSDEGGTQQGRMTAKHHAVQTDPPSVEACECSRYPGGALIRCDSAQIELRVPGGLSGEPTLIEAFAQGLNLHEQTASFMVGFPVFKKDHPREYHLGKTGNFAIQFRAGPRKLQETARKELGLDLPKETAAGMLQALFKRRPQLIAWQDELIALAKTQGYLEIPLLGISRTFLGDPATIDKAFIPTIVNFPVQTTAALLMISAQVAMEKWLRAEGLRTRLVKNVYDEGVYDCPPEEVEQVGEKLPEFYNHPPFLQQLVEIGVFNPAVPLDCAVEITYNSGVGTKLSPPPEAAPAA